MTIKRPKAKSSALGVKQHKRTAVASVPVAESPRSKMESLALEYDLLCAASGDVRKHEGKPTSHFINMIDRRLPAIEGMLSTSEPQNINDLFISAVMLRSKIAELRDDVGPIIRIEDYGERVFTTEDYEKFAPRLLANIIDLQAMISMMLDGMERVSGTTAKRLGIDRIASGPDGSERD